MVFGNIKKMFGGKPSDSEYVEIDIGKESKKAKIFG